MHNRRTTKQIGNEAELFAAKILREQGLELIARNVTFKFGELDLIMKDKESLVFVEVRKRNTHRFGGAIGSITATKQKRLTRAALAYLQRQGLMDKIACRFDLVAIEEKDDQLVAKWLKNIF